MRATAKVTRDSDPDAIFEFISNDKYLEQIYADIYSILLDGCTDTSRILEIGSGSGIVKRYFPGVTTTDLFPGEHVEVLTTHELLQNIRLADRIILKDTLHHLSSPKDFFEVLESNMRSGVKVVFFEPYWGRFAHFVYTFLHPEPFNDKSDDWDTGPRPWDANQAIPYLIIERDSEKFKAYYKSLELKVSETFLGISYLLSGGVFNRTWLPSWFLLKVFEVEKRFPRFARLFHLGIFFSIQKV